MAEEIETPLYPRYASAIKVYITLLKDLNGILLCFSTWFSRDQQHPSCPQRQVDWGHERHPQQDWKCFVHGHRIVSLPLPLWPSSEYPQARMNQPIICILLVHWVGIEKHRPLRPPSLSWHPRQVLLSRSNTLWNPLCYLHWYYWSSQEHMRSGHSNSSLLLQTLLQYQQEEELLGSCLFERLVLCSSIRNFQCVCGGQCQWIFQSVTLWPSTPIGHHW